MENLFTGASHALPAPSIVCRAFMDEIIKKDVQRKEEEKPQQQNTQEETDPIKDQTHSLQQDFFRILCFTE